MSKVLFVEHCADDFLGGTANMDAMTELAYRRICDLIYSTNDKLMDNDSLQYATKTGSKWKKIRKELIEVYGKIYVEDGFIRQKTCQEKIEKARKNIEQKALAGNASAEARKALKNNDTPSTAVETPVNTPVPTSVPTNQEPKNPNKEKDKKEAVSRETCQGPIEDIPTVDDFFNAYPKGARTAIGAVREAWQSQVFFKNADPNQIMRAVKNFARKHADTEDKFIPKPARFLNEQMYLDPDLQGEEPKPLDKSGWQQWHHEAATVVGSQIVNSWLLQAERHGETIIFSAQFARDRIFQQYKDNLKQIGITEFQVKGAA